MSTIQRAIAATLDFSGQTAINREIGFLLDRSSHPKLPRWMSDPSGHPRGTVSTKAYTHHVGKLLGIFDKLQPKGENTFITFNYDTVLEEALSDLGVPYSYGFNQSYAPVVLDKSATAVDCSEVKVLKLHGSTNWAMTPNNGKEIIIYGQNGQPLTIYGHYSDVRNGGFNPLLIPPTWKKVFEHQMQQVWDSAVQGLETATRIIVIGFSMPPTDLYFKFLIAAGLSENISLRKVYFVDPASEVIKERAEMLWRKEYIKSGKITFHPPNLHSLTIQSYEMEKIGRNVSSSLLKNSGFCKII